MPRQTLNFDTVRKFALQLDGVEDSTVYRSPSLKVRNNLLAWIPPHKSLEPGTLAVRLEIERRDELIAAAPDVYFLTEHYRKYPAVLVRLSRIHPDALQDLLRMAWSSLTAKSSRRSAPRRPPARPKKSRRL